MMLSVIFTILKIIGIILLVLLGLFILLILLALFVPIRYKVKALLDEKKTVVIKVYWLLRIISFKMYKEDAESYLQLRVFGIKVFSTKGKTVDDEELEKMKAEKMAEIINDTKDSEKVQKSEPIVDTLATEPEEISEENQEENFIFRWINSFKRKIKSFFIGIYNRIKGIIIGIKSIIAKIKQIIGYITDSNNRAAVKKIFGGLKSIFKHIFPRKLKVKINYGMSDPATTAYILGGASIVKPWVKGDFRLFADFEAEETYFKGNAYARGRVYMFYILSQALKIYKDKNVKNLIKIILNR